MRKLAPHLRVKLEKGQSSKGKSPYKVVLDTEDKARKHPQDILSEGEQRIVALAAFFADATGRDELTPIVIDDPISSLDYNYEESATKRIVELAKNRQVIVFTHTFCTRLCENESNLKVIQSVMGHSDIQTTMDIYAECTAEKKQEVFATLNGKIMIK